MERYNQELENNLLDMVRQKEESDRKLLRTEIVLCVATGVPCLIMLAIAAAPSVQIPEWLRGVLIVVGLIPFLAAALYAIKIEQTAGYYVCKKCGHKHVPATYGGVLFAPHVNRTRYMRCPECHQKSWQKKVISKE